MKTIKNVMGINGGAQYKKCTEGTYVYGSQLRTATTCMTWEATALI